MKRITVITLTVLFILSCLNLSVYADMIITETEIILPRDGYYANNRVVVILDNQTSLNFRSFAPSDFSSVGCKSVRDLSESVTADLQEKAEIITANILDNKPLEEFSHVEFSNYHQILCLELEEGGRSNIVSAIKKLSRIEGVIGVYPDYKLKLSGSDQSDNTAATSTNTQNYYDMLGVESALDYLGDNTNVRVGIIDTGINKDHIDLQDNLDLSSFVDYTYSTPQYGYHYDSQGHGTFVAGIIGAVYDNDTGIDGICPDVSLVSLKVANDGQPYCSDIASAIMGAWEDGIQILNIGGYVSADSNKMDIDLSTLEYAINDYSGLVVTSAGVGGVDITNGDTYPACFDLDNLLVVAASSGNGLASGSNYSDITVDVMAPIDDLYSTTMNGGYATSTNASYAAAVASGVAALMLYKNNQLNGREIKAIIMEEVWIASEFEENCFSGGRINADWAVGHAVSEAHLRSGGSHTYCVGVSCNSCGYSDMVQHSKYVYNAGNDNYYVKCDRCDYSYHLCECPEYWATSHSYHTVSCIDGCYSFIEAHNDMSYTSTGAQGYHMALCRDCGMSHMDNHNWQPYGTRYRCTECLQIETIIADIISLPPETDDTETE